MCLKQFSSSNLLPRVVHPVQSARSIFLIQNIFSLPYSNPLNGSVLPTGKTLTCPDTNICMYSTGLKKPCSLLSSCLIDDRDTEKNLSNEHGHYIFLKYIFFYFKSFIFNTKLLIQQKFIEHLITARHTENIIDFLSRYIIIIKSNI